MHASNFMPWLVTAMLLVLLPATAGAQDIRELNADGIKAFSEGNFEEAASKFSQAYAIKPEPPLKKNEALAWFKADKCEPALVAAKEYLAMGVDNERSTLEAQKVLVVCHTRAAEAHIAGEAYDAADAALAAARESIPPPPEDPAAENPFADESTKIAELEAQVKSKREEEAAARQAAIDAAEAEKARQIAAEKNKRTQTLGMGLMGGGGAIVLGALVYHIALATGTSKKFKQAAASGDRERYDKLGKRLETGNWLVPTLYAVGLATSGVGFYLWWSAGGLEPAPEAVNLGGLESLGVTASWAF